MLETLPANTGHEFLGAAGRRIAWRSVSCAARSSDPRQKSRHAPVCAGGPEMSAGLKTPGRQWGAKTSGPRRLSRFRSDWLADSGLRQLPADPCGDARASSSGRAKIGALRGPNLGATGVEAE